MVIRTTDIPKQILIVTNMLLETETCFLKKSLVLILLIQNVILLNTISMQLYLELYKYIILN